MTNAQIKAAQLAKIKAILKVTGNFKGAELTAAAKMTQAAIQAAPDERTALQDMLIQNFSKHLLAQEKAQA